MSPTFLLLILEYCLVSMPQKHTHTHRLTTILFLAHTVPDLSPLNVVQVKFSVAGQLLIQI